uniref:SFRICE_011211 n=1 Tax=Spodoptera frugiperda TaxID=7108 RepID=A0A2H1VPS2_SPOFR
MFKINAIEGQTYEMIPTNKGKFLLMFRGYTYYQQNRSSNYYCSKKHTGCQARLKLDSNGKILSTAFTTHMHPAPQYVILNGCYVKVILTLNRVNLVTIIVLKNTQGVKLGSGITEDQTYEMIPTNKGKCLLMFRGYTYCQQNRSSNYYCSKNYTGCKARLKLDYNGKIISAIEGQSYEMIPTRKGKFLLMFQGYTYSQQNQSRNYYCSKKDVGCKARLKLDSNGKIISSIEEQTYEMIPTKKGKFLLMFRGYTYYQQNRSSHYYCSKKKSGCAARVKLDSNGKIMSTAFATHLHPAPQYVISNGRYIKFILIAGSIEGQTYEMIPTNKGKFLIMFQGYTYSQARQTCNYYCSKKDMGCRARLKLDANGKILPTSFTLHIHDPPKYMISRGEYIKLCR